MAEKDNNYNTDCDSKFIKKKKKCININYCVLTISDWNFKAVDYR